jgi:Leucine-rich repeat (LRR) protein
MPCHRQCVAVVGYAMTNLKLISTILFATLFAIVACSTTTSKFYSADIVHNDTTYTTSTQQLKSDRIPDSIFQFTQLRHLSINGMDCDYGDRKNCWMIKEIPSDIKNLKNLTTLRLTLNAIATIPHELTDLQNLTLIDLTDNAGLTNIDNLTQLPNLQYLYLYGCGLTKLPDNIGDLKNLKELGLVGNHLDKTEQTRIKKALPNCEIKF